jgi:predicted permease
MPSGFGFPSSDAAFWVPLPIDTGGGRGMLLPAIARLRPDAALPAVLEEGRRVMEASGSLREGGTLVVRTMKDLLVGPVERLLWVLLSAVGLVFAIASTNIALLLMTRGAARERELSIRVAVGASRGRLVRQLLLEAALLAGIGGIAGVFVAGLSLEVLVGLAPPDMPRLREAALDPQVLAFAAGLTLASSLFFGVVSAGRIVAIDPVRALGRLGGDAAHGRSSRRKLNVLAAAELALTLVLLVGAGLLLRSFVRTLLLDQGFHAPEALALQIHLPAARYPGPEARFAFHERLLDRLRTVDGLVAGITTSMPNRQPSARFILNSTPVPEVFDPLTLSSTEVRSVSEGFLEAAGIPLRAGRFFDAGDRAGSEDVAIISEALARQLFPDRDAVGQTLYSIRSSWRVVGVAGDVRPAAPGGAIAPAAYVSVRQDIEVLQWFGTVTVVARGADPRQLAGTLRSLVLSLDPEMPPYNVRTLGEELSRLVAGPRFSATLLGTFGVMALVLAAIGVYGVMAHAAGQRTREVGVRIALGATRSRVLWLMLRDGMLVLAGGLIVGLLASLWLSRSLTGLLHEVTPGDPVTIVPVAMLLAAAGLLASYVPARRATGINAIEALREE